MNVRLCTLRLIPIEIVAAHGDRAFTQVCYGYHLESTQLGAANPIILAPIAEQVICTIASYERNTKRPKPRERQYINFKSTTSTYK